MLVGYRPVINELRDGLHSGNWQYARSNRTPAAATHRYSACSPGLRSNPARWQIIGDDEEHIQRFGFGIVSLRKFATTHPSAISETPKRTSNLDHSRVSHLTPANIVTGGGWREVNHERSDHVASNRIQERVGHFALVCKRIAASRPRARTRLSPARAPDDGFHANTFAKTRSRSKFSKAQRRKRSHRPRWRCRRPISSPPASSQFRHSGVKHVALHRQPDAAGILAADFDREVRNWILRTELASHASASA